MTSRLKSLGGLHRYPRKKETITGSQRRLTALTDPAGAAGIAGLPVRCEARAGHHEPEHPSGRGRTSSSWTSSYRSGTATKRRAVSRPMQCCMPFLSSPSPPMDWLAMMTRPVRRVATATFPSPTARVSSWRRSASTCPRSRQRGDRIRRCGPFAGGELLSALLQRVHLCEGDAECLLHEARSLMTEALRVANDVDKDVPPELHF